MSKYVFVQLTVAGVIGQKKNVQSVPCLVEVEHSSAQSLGHALTQNRCMEGNLVMAIQLK